MYTVGISQVLYSEHREKFSAHTNDSLEAFRGQISLMANGYCKHREPDGWLDK